MPQTRWIHPSHARMKGQGHIWDSQVLGPLSNKKIQSYVEAGYYGTQRALRAVEARLAKERRKKAKRTRKVRTALDI